MAAARVPAIVIQDESDGFRRITTTIPSGSLEDLTSLTSSAPLTGGDAAPGPPAAAAAATRSASQSASQPSQSRALTDEEVALSEHVRAKYDAERADSDGDGADDLPPGEEWEEREEREVEEEEEEKEDAAMSAATAAREERRARGSGSGRDSARVSRVLSPRLEAAGGMEDWTAVGGQNVDRYGFITPPRRARATRSQAAAPGAGGWGAGEGEGETEAEGEVETKGGGKVTRHNAKKGRNVNTGRPVSMSLSPSRHGQLVGLRRALSSTRASTRASSARLSNRLSTAGPAEDEEAADKTTEGGATPASTPTPSATSPVATALATPSSAHSDRSDKARTSVRTRLRQAASRLPHSRGRSQTLARPRPLSEATTGWTSGEERAEGIGVGHGHGHDDVDGDGDGDADGDGHSSAVGRRRAKERRREEKWRAMATVVGPPAGARHGVRGGGMEFSFDGGDGKVVARTWKGIPDRWRATAWHAFLAASALAHHDRYHQRDAAGEAALEACPRCLSDGQLRARFRALQGQSCADDGQIDVDVPRTISRHIMFRRRYRGGQRLLFRVLHALALHFPAPGYVQGMAALAATLLTYYREEDAFLMLVRMWQLRGLAALYSPDFAGLFLALAELETAWLGERAVARKLRELNVSSTAYGTRWYLTLFNHSIPYAAQLRVWDVFMLLDGAGAGLGAAAVVHATAAALLHACRPVLLAADFETAMQTLTSALPVRDCDRLLAAVRAEWERRRRRRRHRPRRP